MRFGLPYPADIRISRVAGRFYEVQTCPLCGDEMADEINADSKPVRAGITNYQRHFVENHPEESE